MGKRTHNLKLGSKTRSGTVIIAVEGGGEYQSESVDETSVKLSTLTDNKLNLTP